MSNLKSLVMGKVRFTRYKEGELWYVTDDGLFEFPVPIHDIGGATFLAEDKAILFMRYIRKHLDYLEKAKAQGFYQSGNP